MPGPSHNTGDGRGKKSALIVTPANPGSQSGKGTGVRCISENLDSCFRGNDGENVFTQGGTRKSNALGTSQPRVSPFRTPFRMSGSYREPFLANIQMLIMNGLRH